MLMAHICTRTSIAILILVSGITAASAQIYNPSTPAGPPPILPPTPPAAVPGMNPIPAPVARDSRSNPLAPVPGLRLGVPSAETHNDRSIRCTGQGMALGVPAGSMGQYLGECVNAR
jgi:hypothetical protein